MEYTKVPGIRVKNMEKENSYSTMEWYMKEPGKMMNAMVMEEWFIVNKVTIMKVNFYTILLKDKEYFSVKPIPTLGTSKRVKYVARNLLMDKEYINAKSILILEIS